MKKQVRTNDSDALNTTLVSVSGGAIVGGWIGNIPGAIMGAVIGVALGLSAFSREKSAAISKKPNPIPEPVIERPEIHKIGSLPQRKHVPTAHKQALVHSKRKS